MKLLLFVLQSDVLIDPSTVNSFIRSGFAEVINVHVQIHQILHGKKLHLYRTLCYTNSVSIHNVCMYQTTAYFINQNTGQKKACIDNRNMSCQACSSC